MEIGNIPPYDHAAAERAKKRWDSIAKPLESLGLLEEAVIRVSGLTGNADHPINRRAVLMMCSDNGVVAQGVTQTGSEVTAVVANNVTAGDASVCRMARVAGADVFAVDMGMNEAQDNPKIINRRIAAGTQDISLGPAMSKEQAQWAIQAGIDLVADLKEQGYGIIATGEMGIGNTTTSSAMVSVFLNMSPEKTTGRGAGLSTEGLGNKVEVIKRAIKVNRPDPDDPIDVLAKLGGFDIAGMAGVFLGGAIYRIPILADGLISSLAALTAVRICPESKQAVFASHVSAEPSGKLVLDALGLKPMITAEMRLGEGSGAVAVLPILDMAYSVYGGMPTFEEINIESYKPLT